MALHNERDKFSLDDDVAYLNCAYMSPLLKEVEAAGVAGVRTKCKPYQLQVKDFFEPRERVKKLFAELIHCDHPENIALLPSVSYGLASVAKNVNMRKGQSVVLLREQFPSNYYSWDRLVSESGGKLKIVDAPKTEEGEALGKRWNEAILAAIDEDTAVVALPIMHWSDGTVFDVAAVRRKTLEVGALLVLDGTQSIGALPFSVSEVQPDALVCAAYKWLLGPYSYALAYFSDRLCETGVPIEESWMNRSGSEQFARLVNYEPRYKEGAERFSVGESSNFILLPMVEKALEQILYWGVKNIQDYCSSLTKPLCTQLRSLGFRVEDDDFRAGHLFCIKLPRHLDPAKVVASLAKNKIFVSQRGDAIRVSVHLFNTESDLNRLLNCLKDSL